MAVCICLLHSFLNALFRRYDGVNINGCCPHRKLKISGWTTFWCQKDSLVFSAGKENKRGRSSWKGRISQTFWTASDGQHVIWLGTAKPGWKKTVFVLVYVCTLLNRKMTKKFPERGTQNLRLWNSRRHKEVSGVDMCNRKRENFSSVCPEDIVPLLESKEVRKYSLSTAKTYDTKKNRCPIKGLAFQTTANKMSDLTTASSQAKMQIPKLIWHLVTLTYGFVDNFFSFLEKEQKTPTRLQSFKLTNRRQASRFLQESTFCSRFTWFAATSLQPKLFCPWIRLLERHNANPLCDAYSGSSSLATAVWENPALLRITNSW